jgi:hypothetical protein
MFWAYAKHEQEKEDIIQLIVNEALNQNTSFSIQLDDDFSDDEIKEIEREVYRRLGYLNYG